MDRSNRKKDGSIVQKINEGQLANSILKSTHLIIYRKKGFESDILYEYQEGVYKTITPLELKGIAQRYVPISIGKDNIFRDVASRMLYTASNCIIDFETMNYNERYINLKNGLYDAEDIKMINHTPKLLSTIQLDCKYCEEYKEPYYFTKYINDLCNDGEGNIDFQKIAVLQEWAGLILSNIWGHRVKKCLVLYSALGNTGKSLFLSIMRELLGVENVANISIQKMGSDRWAGANLYAKRLNAVGDQQANDIVDSSVFKEVTGGDAITVEFKGKQPFPYIFRGVIGIACNELPVFMDDKGGHIYERLHIIPCFNVIPKEQRDPRLLEKIMTERYMVFKWALVGLHRLINNNYIFSQCDAADKAMKDYRSRSNTQYRFITERYEVTGNERKDRVSKLDFANGYNAFCIEKGLFPIKENNIPSRMEKEGFPLKLYCGYPYYKGIKPRELIEADEQIEF
ncbi:MAG: phage/plasmid primase, P4 family [Aminipila sp.]